MKQDEREKNRNKYRQTNKQEGPRYPQRVAKKVTIQHTKKIRFKGDKRRGAGAIQG